MLQFILTALVILAAYVLGLLTRPAKYEINPENVERWLAKMSLEERSAILYPLVKNVYYGRRTIHKCPSRKQLNMVDGL